MISFGLNREYYHKVLKDIDYIVRNSNGGYTFTEVYSFPIWLRRLTIKNISDEIHDRNNKMQEAQGKAHEWKSKDLRSLKDRMKDAKSDKPVNKPYVSSGKKK